MTFTMELNDAPQFMTAIRALRRPMNVEIGRVSEPTEADLALGRKLVLRGDDHAKFARLIHVGFTCRAPRYWWIEFSTYRVGADSVSESTMHRKLSEPWVAADFEDRAVSVQVLCALNVYAGDVREGRCNISLLKRHIPEGMLQTRDCTMSYQTLRHIYFARKTHRLPHWQAFCAWIETLPHASEWITVTKD